MLASGCVEYLANVIDMTKEVILEPKDVPVVREFLNVFLEDLPGLLVCVVLFLNNNYLASIQVKKIIQ